MFVILSTTVRARAEAGLSPAAQEGTPGYNGPEPDVPTSDYPYPSGGESPTTPAATPASGFTQTPRVTFTLSGSPTASPTTTLTPTLAPNIFRTEDSEMNGAQVTPPVTDTPAPTSTEYLTPTLTQPAPTATLVPLPPKGRGYQMDWGLFWIGFSVPVLVSCGAVLYFLDRRPDLFRLHK